MEIAADLIARFMRRRSSTVTRRGRIALHESLLASCTGFARSVARAIVTSAVADL